MERYAELDAIEKAAKEEKEALKPQVREYLRQQGHPLFSYTGANKKKIDLNYDKVWEWIQTLDIPPEKLEEVSEKTYTIASRGLDELYACQYIEPEDIPEDCYNFSGANETIRVKKPKD